MGRPRYSRRVNAHSEHDARTMFCSFHWFANKPIRLERHIDVHGVMLLLAKSHYQPTLGWIMGPLLRSWRWFIALFSKHPKPLNQIEAKVIPMTQASTSSNTETTPPSEAESNPTLHEEVQQPAMYIYNLSRSQWANRLNLEWIYLDVAVKGESDFILLVNPVPEESTAIDYEELTQASHALQSWLEIRNSEELIDGLQDTRPVGKMISLTVADSLQNHISEHVGEKQHMLAGGNKKFYRDLSIP